MFFLQSKTARLIKELNSNVESKAKNAASLLDALLYPNYGPGPRTISAAESQQISEAHYQEIRGSKTLTLLLDAARRGSEFGRAYVVSALGPIGDPLALPVLVDALSDDSPKVRAAAATGLMYFRDLSTLPSLIRALEDPEPEVRCSAASVLGSFRSVDAVAPLTTFYERGDSQAKAAALRALGNIGDPQSLPLARAALLDKARKVREAAKSALADFDLKRRRESGLDQ